MDQLYPQVESGDVVLGKTVDKRRYNYMENILQNVIAKISVGDSDRKRNNVLLNAAIEKILSKLRDISPSFSKLYQRIFYGGSYYDRIKTGKPDEYDIDLLLLLPKRELFVLETLDEVPGYVKLTYKGDTANSDFIAFFEGDTLCANRVLKWMEGLMARTFQEFPQSGSQAVINIEGTEFYIKFSKSGPAFTIHLSGQIDQVHLNFDVDLVPCFVLSTAFWPQGDFKANPSKEKTDFFIVPKTPKATQLSCPTNFCWRLSFQEQERQMIHGNKTLKPCIKLMKKLRDHLQQVSIRSYYIKTMFLWEVEKQPKAFWENSLSYVFMEMLQVYERRLRDGRIEYYWNMKNNLLAPLSNIMLENYSNRVRSICSAIHNKRDIDPAYIATFFLSEEEVAAMRIELAMPIAKSKTYGNGCGDEVANKKGKAADFVEICTNCDLGAAIQEMRREIQEARQEQQKTNVEILNNIAKIAKRLDKIENRF